MELTDEDRAIIRLEMWSHEAATDLYIAGLRAGIERAVKVCETSVVRPRDTVGERWAYSRCATAIRALLTDPPV